MKKITQTILTFSLVAIAVGAYAFTSPGGDKVKVKIVKIVDGDTTITEKIVEESELAKIDQDIKDVKGKNVKVMMYVDKEGKGKDEKKGEQKEETITMSKSFSFDFDSLMKTMKIEMNIDSLVNSIKNGFDFTIVTEDDDNKNGEKKVIIKKSGKNAYSFSTDSLGVNIQEFENDGSGGKNSTIIITSPGDKDGKKVMVKTTVVVIDDNDRSSDPDKNGTGKKKSHSKNEKEAKDDLKFYPNPSDGKFTIEYDLKDKETAVITVLDANGKQLFKDEIKGGGKYNKTVDLGGKGKGVFILNLTQGKKSISKKIIIE